MHRLAARRPRYSLLVRGVSLLAAVAPGGSVFAQGEGRFQPILESLQAFEGKNDPKCHATASRLENFIYGTPLSPQARFEKNALVTTMVRECWALASRLARNDGANEIAEEALGRALEFYPKVSFDAPGNVWVIQSGERELTISERDKKHYSSVAYAQRAILAARQSSSEGDPLLPLSEQAMNLLKTRADLYQLAAIKLADRAARSAGDREISAGSIADQWRSLALPDSATAVTATKVVPGAIPLLPQLVKQKLASYEEYNGVANQLFVRNLQVYYAKRRWPASAEEGTLLKENYASSVINYALDVYVAAQKRAAEEGRSLVSEEDVHHVVQTFTPFDLNQFEDVIFFPRLGNDSVVIEAYDLDSFRDGGLHWKYLGFALNESRGAITMDADPFAAELIAEAIAQFGVLTWRITGEVAIELDDERLSVSHLKTAMQRIQARINRQLQGEFADVPPDSALRSSPEAGSPTHFSDVTAQSGIAFEHRSSDWLSRLLRSYLDAGDNRGVITIPPAFGGSGIGAEDLDNDGDIDLLVLGGAGNTIYRNDGGTFTDITAASGVVWVRPEDGRPGEPRQPVVADFDNDGWQDILITYVDDEHRLYRNAGDGTFADVTADAALGGKGLVGGPATVFDFDRDGLLDIYIGYFGNYLTGTLPTLERRNRNGSPNQLFRNVGGMRFENVTERSGTGDVGWAQAVGHTDFDGDGWQDLIAGNDFGVNTYFRNNGDGTFEDVSSQIGTDKPSYTMGIGITDLNGDQLPDLYISNIVTMNKDQKYVLPSKDTEMKFDVAKLANMRVVEANDLFISKGGGKFEISKRVDRGYSSTGWSWDADFFDSDHDGDDDLYVLNGMNDFNVYSKENPYYTAPDTDERTAVTFAQSNAEKNVFFANKEGRLQQQSDSGLDLLANARSAAYLDFDGDGDLDIAVNNYHDAANILRNNTGSNSGNWIKIRLVGDPDKGVSRDAIGAKITVTPTGLTPIWREVHGTIGYLSVHPKEQHFGVAGAGEIDLSVVWPNGEEQQFKGITPNRSYTLTQGAVPQVRN